MSSTQSYGRCVEWIWSGDLAAMHYTDGDLQTLARVLSRTCPRCQARPGSYCRRTRSGRVIDDLDGQHLARRMWREQ
ncbi:hypothetical protein ABN034_34055 [Actinopolymorpha sp. B11F2]|uniref:zinc finger domain-containing protein n=1 Tax=Actinopolymorpha sp. B11F2 TaxID=3160862 RepID=UPI0032E38574